jgi:hypothetical protein
MWLYDLDEVVFNLNNPENIVVDQEFFCPKLLLYLWAH